jgi:hypothetical protein
MVALFRPCCKTGARCPRSSHPARFDPPPPAQRVDAERSHLVDLGLDRRSI